MKMATYKIADIEGIGNVNAGKLKKAGIRTVNNLLQKGATRQGRKHIADISGLSESVILKWVNFADLYRVKGVGSEYSDLLEKAGVDTIKELATRKPEHVYAKLEEINKKYNLVRALPGLKRVQGWVSEAKRLKPKVTY